MSKIALFSDLHIHPYREFATVGKDGLNSRLLDTLLVLDRILEYCVKESIDDVLFAGDLFHKKRVLGVSYFNEAYDRLLSFKHRRVNLYAVPGNHDHASRDGKTHSLHAFRSVLSGVYHRPSIAEISEGVYVNFVPYMSDVEALKVALTPKRPKEAEIFLCVAHMGVFGATTGQYEFVPPEELTPDDLPDGLYDFGFLGHYHKRQEVKKKWWYIGSPLQHGRGDRADKGKGFLVYDTESYEKVPFEIVKLDFPEFVVLTQDDIEKKSAKLWGVKGNFVDAILDDEPEGGADGFTTMLMKLGARGANVTVASKSTSSAARLNVTPTLSPQEMVSLYIKEYASGDLDKKRLLTLAKELLDRAEKGV